MVASGGSVLNRSEVERLVREVLRRKLAGRSTRQAKGCNRLLLRPARGGRPIRW